MPRSPLARAPLAALAALGLAVVLAVVLAACDDGDSNDADRPRRTTTSSAPSTTTTTTASTTTPPAGGGTIPDQPDVPTTIPPATVGSCGNQTDALVAAITGSDVGGLDARRGQFTVRECRIAASAPIWAAATIVPNPGIQLDRSTVVLQRIGALWNVEEVGTSNLGCDAPPAVRADLGISCPG